MKRFGNEKKQQRDEVEELSPALSAGSGFTWRATCGGCASNDAKPRVTEPLARKRAP